MDGGFAAGFNAAEGSTLMSLLLADTASSISSILIVLAILGTFLRCVLGGEAHYLR